jgi:hypothetical protein
MTLTLTQDERAHVSRRAQLFIDGGFETLAYVKEWTRDTICPRTFTADDDAWIEAEIDHQFCHISSMWRGRPCSARCRAAADIASRHSCGRSPRIGPTPAGHTPSAHSVSGETIKPSTC